MTDLSFINSCETITDAVNEPEYEPEIMNSISAYSAGGEGKYKFFEIKIRISIDNLL